MPGHDIIVIGTSAGGVEALRELVSGLPPDLAAAIFVVMHVAATSDSVLPKILSRSGPLPASHAVDGEAIEQGRIYVAPPDHHLLVERGRVRVTYGPKENRMRPAADPLFRSAALAYGPRVVGVVLTGALDDGTAGLLAVKRRGGLAVVQDPRDALYPGMPRSALSNVAVDHCLALPDIAPLLVQLAATPTSDEDAYPVPEALEIESEIARGGSHMEDVEKLGQPSAFSCPECNGVLWEVHDGELLRFRCQVGHAYSANNLLVGQSEYLEGALWAALRALEEQVTLYGRMAHRARQRNQELLVTRFEKNARELDQHATVIRQVLRDGVNADEGQ